MHTTDKYRSSFAPVGSGRRQPDVERPRGSVVALGTTISPAPTGIQAAGIEFVQEGDCWMDEERRI